MKLQLTKEQYRDLLGIINVANSVVGVLKDHIDDKKYSDLYKRWEKIENHIEKSADDFDCSDMFEKWEDQNILKEKIYDTYFELVEEYDALATHMFICNDLAWRDFHETFTEKEIKNMTEHNRGYFGVELYPFEKKYWDEININGYKRFRIVE